MIYENMVKHTFAFLAILFGVTYFSHAQLTVQNNSTCPLIVSTAQWDDPGCGMCSSITTTVPAGGQVVIPNNPSCTIEYWAGVQFAPAVMGPYGSTPNPTQKNGCPSSFTFPGQCSNSGPITAVWQGPGGPGPQTVTIQ